MEIVDAAVPTRRKFHLAEHHYGHSYGDDYYNYHRNQPIDVHYRNDELRNNLYSGGHRDILYDHGFDGDNDDSVRDESRLYSGHAEPLNP
jgi:hypothetical protein